MHNKKYSVVAIGNAMLDLVCEVPEQFLKEEGISKGAMNYDNKTAENFHNDFLKMMDASDEGAKVEFETEDGPKGIRAVQVKTV